MLLGVDLSQRRLLVYCVLTLLFYSIFYLVSLWNPFQGVSVMRVAVVNLDKGFNSNFSNIPSFGKNLANLLLSTDRPWSKEADFRDVDATREGAEKAVDNGRFWAAIIIPESISQDLLANAYADPKRAALTSQSETPLLVQVIHDQARSFSASNLLYTALAKAIPDAAKIAVPEYARSFVESSTPLHLSTALLLEPIKIEAKVLHKVDEFGANLSMNLLFFMLYLTASVSVNMFPRDVLKRTTDPTSSHRNGRNYQSIKWAIGGPLIVQGLIALIHAIVFGGVLFTLVGKKLPSPFILFGLLFFIAYMVNMLSFCFYTILPASYSGILSGLFNALCLTTSGSLLDYILMPSFFKLGYVLPMRYAIRIARFYYFGTGGSTIALDVTVFAVWFFIPIVIYCGWHYYRHRKQEANIAQPMGVVEKDKGEVWKPKPRVASWTVLSA